MFTGIIETLGKVVKVDIEESNKHFFIQSKISNELKIDQSIAHNGVCLTVVEQYDNIHKVTAIKESLERSNLNELKKDDLVNLERCTKVGSRLDGHIVQGHVDGIAICKDIIDYKGSKEFVFELIGDKIQPTVEKGSITVNGVSLTVVQSHEREFSVHLIPYTIEHTNFHNIKNQSTVNIEYDIIGKYVKKLLKMN